MGEGKISIGGKMAKERSVGKRQRRAEKRKANMFEVNKVFYYTRCDTNCQSFFAPILFMSANESIV